MDAIRGFCFYVVLGVTVIFLSLAALLAAPFTNEVWRYEKLCRPWAKFILRTLEVICGVHVKVEGWENMPPAESAHVVLAKHQSAWDPFWLGAWLPARASFLYKKSLHWIPVVGWLIWSMNMLAIDRSQGRSAFQNFMAKGPEYLRRGWWICLFPEGTRVPPGESWPEDGGRPLCSGPRRADSSDRPQCGPLLAQEQHREAPRDDHGRNRKADRDDRTRAA